MCDEGLQITTVVLDKYIFFNKFQSPVKKNLFFKGALSYFYLN